MPHRSAADWTLLLVLVVIWGTAFAFIDVGVETVPPATLVAGRVGVAALVLCAILPPLGLGLPAPGAIWGRFLVLACVGNAVPFVAISWGQQQVDSGLAGVLMGVMPLATLVLAHFFVPEERLAGRTALGFGLGFGGILLLVGPAALARLGGGTSDIVHQLAVLLGALCYAANTIVARLMPATHPVVSAAGVMLMASAIMIPAALVVDAPWRLAPSAASLQSIAWLGLAATGAATVVYFRIVTTAGPTFLSLMNYLIPVVALATGIATRGEAFEWRTAGALVLILAGLWLGQGAGRR